MSRVRLIAVPVVDCSEKSTNKAFQTDEAAASHSLQRAQNLHHGNFATEQRRLAQPRTNSNL
jgi:hypothetical protein